MHEALTAANELAGQNIGVRVLDPFTVKPIDKETIIQNALEVGGRIICVEDHYPEGGLGEAVLSAVAEQEGITVKHLAVPKVPRSGPPNALLDYYGISAKHIVDAIMKKL